MPRMSRLRQPDLKLSNQGTHHDVNMFEGGRTRLGRFVLVYCIRSIRVSFYSNKKIIKAKAVFGLPVTLTLFSGIQIKLLG